MPLETACLAFAGFAQLARSSARYRHRRQLFWSRGGGATRVTGIVLLLLSAAAAFRRFGPVFGAVGWFALAIPAAGALVLLLSARPRLAFAAAPLAVGLAAAAMLTG